MPLRVHRIDVGRRGLVVRQHGLQQALGQVAVHVPLGAHHDAVALQCPQHGDLAVVGGQVAGDLDRLGVRLAAAPGGQAPQAIGLVALADADALVLHQVARHAGPAMAVQVGRRGAQHAPVGGDAAGDHAAVGRLAETHAHVVGIVGDRRRVHRQLQLHIHLGVLAHKVRDHGGDVHAAKAQRGVHAQQALGAGLGLHDEFIERIDLAQDAARVLQQQLALGREAHAARGAVDQHHAQALFHLREVLADRRRGDPHFAPCGAQAGAGGQRRKEAQFCGLDGGTHRIALNFRLTMDSL